MTDSELLDLAKAMVFEAEDTSTTDRAIYPLARFVAHMLDDSPVTEEALLAMGFERYRGELYRDKWHNVELAFYPQGGVGDLYYLAREGFEKIRECTTIGQLRCLLRGLGVGT